MRRSPSARGLPVTCSSQLMVPMAATFDTPATDAARVTGVNCRSGRSERVTQGLATEILPPGGPNSTGVDRKIAAIAKQAEQEKSRQRRPNRRTRSEQGRQRRPRPSEWITEIGIGRPPTRVHARDCHMVGKRRRPINQDEAHRLLAAGTTACTHCRPDQHLGILDLRPSSHREGPGVGVVSRGISRAGRPPSARSTPVRGWWSGTCPASCRRLSRAPAAVAPSYRSGRGPCRQWPGRCSGDAGPPSWSGGQELRRPAGRAVTLCGALRRGTVAAVRWSSSAAAAGKGRVTAG
uniref:DUF6233 domain-containing protein n=1 Tax=Streptomyces olivochromogenes TaxID=1963 RepID=UPI0027E5438E|nr:DUF6233 domain-containing protein [Streptomyces olivochromogenes]